MKRHIGTVLLLCFCNGILWWMFPTSMTKTVMATAEPDRKVSEAPATEELAGTTEELAATTKAPETSATEGLAGTMETPEASATEGLAASATEELAGTTEAPAAATQELASTAPAAASATEKVTAAAAGKTAAATAGKVTAAATEKATGSTESIKEQKTKVKAGWFKKGGSYYYRKSDGSVLRTAGMVKLGKYRYCLGRKGKRLCGLRKVKGNWYYFHPKNGRMEEKAGWKKIKGKKYYIQKKGVVATGVKKIGKLQYGFMSTGELRGVSNPFEYKGKWYRTDRYGVAEKLSSMQLACSRETRKFIERHTTSDMSSQEKLKCLYHILLSGNYVSGCIDRSETEAEGFQYRIAYKVLVNHGKYNCYGFACTIASVAKELGFESYVVVLDCDHAVMMIDGKYYDNMGARFGADSPALKDEKEYKKVKF